MGVREFLLVLVIWHINVKRKKCQVDIPFLSCILRQCNDHILIKRSINMKTKAFLTTICGGVRFSNQKVLSKNWDFGGHQSKSWQRADWNKCSSLLHTLSTFWLMSIIMPASRRYLEFGGSHSNENGCNN